MDTDTTQQLRQLLDDYLRMYASRDDRLTEQFSQDFSGFTGGGDFLVKDRTRWVEITRLDFSQVKEPLRLELKDVSIQSLAETVAVATSFFTIHLPLKDQVLSRETARLVLIFRKEATGWKISHSSISIPYYGVQEGEVYPLNDLADRNQVLERIVAERTDELSKANKALETTLAEVKTLKGLLPICCGCKKIRDDKNYWNEVEVYIMQRTDAQITHSYCPTCLEKYFPGYRSGEEGTPARQ